MCPSKSIYLTFGIAQIGVHSNAPEVLAWVGDRFRAMREPAGRVVSEELEVRREDRGYRIACGNEIGGVESSLRTLLDDLDTRITLHFAQAHPHLLWLHAGAAVRDGVAVLLPGPGGSGKSTLVTGLCARGWLYLSDDLVPLDPETGRIQAFPKTPAVRIPSDVEVPSDLVATLEKRVERIEPDKVCRAATRLGALIFPRFRFGADAALSPCTPAVAAFQLLQQCVNLEVHRSKAVAAVTRLVPLLPARVLSFGDGGEAVALLAGSDVLVQASPTGLP
jgi:hypothetical protein